MREDQDCENWLREELKDGELHLSEDVRSAAREAGFSGRELKEARRKTDTRTFHLFNENGETPNWFWYLEGVK